MIVQTSAGSFSSGNGSSGKGALVLHASSPGLQAGEASVDVLPVAALPSVAEILSPPLVITDWKRSPVSATRPDPNQQTLSSDMNSWTSMHPGAFLPQFRDGTFALYRAAITPRAQMQQQGCQLILRDITGKAQVYVDGKRAAEKVDSAKATLTLALAPAESQRTFTVLIEAPSAGARAGLGGTVTLEAKAHP